MKHIEIRTANNVTIQYELASLGQRLVALMLDLVFVIVYAMIIGFIIGLVSVGSIYSDNYLRTIEIITVFQYLLIYPAYFFYHLACEVFFNGQSLGKKIMKIKVVKSTGEPPNLGDYFIRWVYRLVDLGFSLGAMGAIFISSSERSQRLGDIAANTIVVKLNPTNKYGLRDILKIAKTDNYTPTYPQVTILSDDDMLLIKNAIDRVKKVPNEANKKVVLALVDKSIDKLSITDIPKQKIKFLRTLLKDYIVLTR